MTTATQSGTGLKHNPSWYKNGAIYEVHVRAFCDSNGDGVGDFRGLTQKLDYIKDLGMTAVWLLPFYPSPLKDDGYDIADYCGVHPMYGTLADFKAFLREAHRRDLRVITELVLNHTSDQHPWFQRARRSKPGSSWRNFYVWSHDPSRFSEARIIFEDVEPSNWAWDDVAQSYYWHRFFSHQPDLNYEHPGVHTAMMRVLDFWLDLGVDGLRLDAVPYLYEREGTNCENLPETHLFLKKLRAHVDEKYGGRMLLAEANQWPEDAVSYFGEGKGDECHMAFHFPLMPRLFMALRMEDRVPIVDILEQTPPIPETSQWALFLRNHDELTLEMVTDEERDYMYRMYAQMRQARLNLGIRRRLAPLLGNNRRRIEVLNALLFSLPGTPVLYYGDEIGLGENIYLGDRNGVRTPMQWSSDKNAGFSRANPQSLYLPVILDPEYHYEAVNVEAQLANPHSLLWWMRRLLALRKRWRALGEGKCEFLQPENRKILSYVLHYNHERILVVANLSRFPQPVELDLAAFQHHVPIELFGRTEFPVISEKPYPLTLDPHGFYWFSLEAKAGSMGAGPAAAQAGHPAPSLVESSWLEVIKEGTRSALEAILPDYLRAQSWFRGKPRSIKAAQIRDVIPFPSGDGCAGVLALVQVDYTQSESEIYSLPLAFASGDEARQIRESWPQLVVAGIQVRQTGDSGVLFDAVASPAFCREWLHHLWHRKNIKGDQGQAEPMRMPAFQQLWDWTRPADSQPGMSGRNNTTVFFGDKLVLKIIRRIEPGTNPELELAGWLTDQGFPNSPILAGTFEYVTTDNLRFGLASVTGFVPAAGDAWKFTVDSLGRYFDRAITWVAQGRDAVTPPPGSTKLMVYDIPNEVVENIGTYIESARLLGARTAELHLALSSAGEDKDLVPEPFTVHYQRGLFQTMRSSAVQAFRALRSRLETIPQPARTLAEKVAVLEGAVVQVFRALLGPPLAAKRIRVHGDCRLEEVLWTGKDFVFIDLEGDLNLALSERRLKRSPFHDVARMLRSLHYAANEGVHRHFEQGSIPDENLPKFDRWVGYWTRWVSVAFLRAYIQRLEPGGLLPAAEPQLHAMLKAYLLHRVMGELVDELSAEHGRPEVPLQSVLLLVG